MMEQNAILVVVQPGSVVRRELVVQKVQKDISVWEPQILLLGRDLQRWKIVRKGIIAPEELIIAQAILVRRERMVHVLS